MLRYRLGAFVVVLAASVGGTILWGPAAFFTIWFLGALALLAWLSTIDKNDDSNYPRQP